MVAHGGAGNRASAQPAPPAQGPCLDVAAGSHGRSTVCVLGVLHDGHQHCAGYTYWHLIKLLDAYAADLVCIEVGAERFARADFRTDSPEKWGIALPWAQRHHVPVAPIDGGGLDARRAEQEFAATPQGQHTLAELDAVLQQILAEAGGYDPLVATYEATNSRTTQEVFRRVHHVATAMLGELLTNGWDRRNAFMAERIGDALAVHGARRAIVPVGCEHKYALDDLLATQDGYRVVQLADFLTEPITLTDEEWAAFQQGIVPLAYPSDLMFLHRTLHGGEPSSYSWGMPPVPEAIDLTNVGPALSRWHAAAPGDPELHYYRGMEHYVRSAYHDALAEFASAARDRTRMVTLVPLWELALLRQGQMWDLLGHREQAVACYTESQRDGSGAFDAALTQALTTPFVRGMAALAFR